MRSSFNAPRTLTAVLIACLWTSAASAQGAPETTPPNDDKPFCDRYGLVTVLLRCLPHDLGGLARTDALVSLGVGGALAGVSHHFDDEVFRKFAEPQEDTSVAVGRVIGEAGVQFGAPAAAYFITRAIGSEGGQQLSIMIVRTQMVNAVLTRGLKLFPRARPYQQDATPGQGSFPSGHASASFATATVVQRKWGWKAGVPAYAAATFISVTRLQNVHFLSDVTFGAAVGIASGLAINLPGPHPTVAPLIAPGVVGVSITIGAPRS